MDRYDISGIASGTVRSSALQTIEFHVSQTGREFVACVSVAATDGERINIPAIVFDFRWLRVIGSGVVTLESL
jgi:hypothetical protein